MTLKEIRDEIRSMPESGYLNADNRFSSGFIDDLIHEKRAAAIVNLWNVNRHIPQQWLQTYYPEYSKDYQDGELCFVRYKIPRLVTISNLQQGISFIGSDGVSLQFKLFDNRSSFMTARQHKIWNPASGRYVAVLMSGDEIEIYSKVNITEPPRIEGMFMNPCDVPTYNRNVDDYPVESTLLAEMKRLIMGMDMVVITKSAIDRVTQGRDDSAIPMKQ